MPHTFMRQTHTHTSIQRVETATNSQTCLFDKLSKWFISLTVTWESRKVFPNKDVSSVSKMAQTWDEAYLSKGRRIRLYLIHQAFKMYSFQINTPNHNKIKADG